MAVVLFHFRPEWLVGGFIGVDIFFVISGFLMTAIILNGFRRNTFSLISFYSARANRIIPAMAFLCLVMLIFGYFFTSPSDYETLAKHILSSLSFLSNFIYWSEAGYFEAISKSKWLLHTWSLSVEWQFYIIYPIVLVILRRITTENILKLAVLLGFLLGFILCVIASSIWEGASYYLLPTRAWQMLAGGIVFLYPLQIKDNYKGVFSYIGLSLILLSYFLISENVAWPGYLAIVPVIGAFMILQANCTTNIILNNKASQKIGLWSYSIYLWHWPIVVAFYYYSIDARWIPIGILVSFILGALSREFIETINFQKQSKFWNFALSKPILMAVCVGLLSFSVFYHKGFMEYSSHDYKMITKLSEPSPYRDKCHIDEYKNPSEACEYFNSNVSWAVLGDSHSVELAYSLAKILKDDNIGIKHLTFSGCVPSYKTPQEDNKCSKWYNDSLKWIIQNEDVEYVVFNHRFTSTLIGGDASKYPYFFKEDKTIDATSILADIDNIIKELAKHKKRIYVLTPFPELSRSVNQLVGKAYINNENLGNIANTSVEWYRNRNKLFIEHLNDANYPSNVKVVKTENIFCDSQRCYAVRGGKPLYFDDDHPSVIGAGMVAKKLYSDHIKHID